MMKNSISLKNFRPAMLFNELRHVWLLVYWPIFGLLFNYVESVYKPARYFEMHCALDDVIPFIELFVIPYIFWFVYIAGMLAYTFFCEVSSFKKMMRFIIFTYTITLVIYFIFPTIQHLRPDVFARDNLLTRFMADFYAYDTNTNICPSLHVIGSVAVMLCAFDTKRFSTFGWKIAFGVTTAIICVSTVFLKQHSVIDIFAAIPVCIAGYYISYWLTQTANSTVIPTSAVVKGK